MPITNLRRYGDTPASHHLDKMSKAVPLARFNTNNAEMKFNHIDQQKETDNQPTVINDKAKMPSAPNSILRGAKTAWRLATPFLK